MKELREGVQEEKLLTTEVYNADDYSKGDVSERRNVEVRNARCESEKVYDRAKERTREERMRQADRQAGNESVKEGRCL